MPTVPILADADLSPEARAVFEDIRRVRSTDFVNRFWRALANDPPLLKSTWERLKDVMGPGELDPLVKEMIYIAVSATNSCAYCIHSHSAAARAKGMTPAQHAELMAVIGMAATTNVLSAAMGIEPDPEFLVGETG